MIISIFAPHGGCPETCRFCDQHVSGGTAVSTKRVTETIEIFLKTSTTQFASEVAFYGGTFTAMPRDRQKAYLEAVRPYLQSGQIGGVRISTRPDAIDPAWLLFLKNEYALQTVELGVQSFEDPILISLGRSHTQKDAVKALNTLRALGLCVSFHLMIGCPGESPENDDHLSCRLLALKPDFVRIHPLLVLKGTPLEQDWAEERFTPIGLEEAIERLARLVPRIEEAGIKVIRLGLQPNELLGDAVLAGAYHPALGALVRARVWRNHFESRFATLLNQPPKPAAPPAVGRGIELWAPERLLSDIRGEKSKNILWLKNRFQLSKIKVCVLKEPQEPLNLYDAVQIRLCHTDRPAQRRQIKFI